MVRAILDGRKTQTRRVVKPQPCEAGFAAQPFNWSRVEKVGIFFHIISDEPSAQFTVQCPYGTPGDRLWVKETWAENDPPSGYLYSATDSVVGGLKWRPSIFMKRDASRITLEIVSIRVERVQAISRGDATCEGCPFPNMADGPNPKWWFRDLWDSINAKRGYGWDANPWVWVIEFKRVQP